MECPPLTISLEKKRDVTYFPGISFQGNGLRAPPLSLAVANERGGRKPFPWM